MAKEREALNLDDSIDLEELVQVKPEQRHIGKSQLEKIAEHTGFISRQPRKKRSRTKYTSQLNIKVRDGLKPLFQIIGTHLETFDNETFERAILALIEKEGTNEHLIRFKELTK